MFCHSFHSLDFVLPIRQSCLQILIQCESSVLYFNMLPYFSRQILLILGILNSYGYLYNLGEMYLVPLLYVQRSELCFSLCDQQDSSISLHAILSWPSAKTVMLHLESQSQQVQQWTVTKLSLISTLSLVALGYFLRTYQMLYYSLVSLIQI